MSDRDDADPSDWLASQFGGEDAAKPTPTPPPAAPVPPVAPAQPTPPAPFPPAPVSGSGFSWGLTPSDPSAPKQPDPAPQEPVATPPQQPVATPPQQPAPPQHPAPPAEVPPTEPYLPPTAAFTMPADVPTTPYNADSGVPTAPFTPGAEIEQLPPDRTQWMAAPVDPALDGVTEVIEAEIVGLGAPDGEGVEASALDSLFGDTQFREYSDDLITVPPPREATGDGAKPPRPPRGPIPRLQKILMGVAGGLIGVLLLLLLFMLGTRLAATLGPAPAISPTPTASSGPIVLPIGPVAPGDYQWDELLGGECLAPYESAWQDTYTVVDCALPHPAQMVYRGLFDDTSVAVYPGIEELQTRINLLCTAPTVIDYAKAGAATDLQVEASFAADAAEWGDGNRTYFCFVSRASGDDLTQSVAVPQLAPTPAPSPSPAG